MSHLYYHRADSKGLHAHLDLAGDGGGKVDAASFCNMTQHGNISFPGYEYSCNGPMYYCKWGFSEIKKLGLANYCKTNKGAADKDFVGQRVYHSAELADNV